jgi:hypothetical protein
VKPFIKSSAKAKADPDYYRSKIRRAQKKLATLTPGKDDVKISDCKAQIEWAERMVQVANNLLTQAVIAARPCPLCLMREGMWCGFVNLTRMFACLPRWDPNAKPDALTKGGA